MVDGVPVGYWEWFRLDGTKMRSGYFESGEQIGEWTTYDKNGQVYKVTKMKPKAARSCPTRLLLDFMECPNLKVEGFSFSFSAYFLRLAPTM